MKKIKICYIVSSLANEGPVNVLFNIVKFINLSFFDVVILTLVPEKTHSRVNDFLKLGIEVIALTDKTLSKGFVGKIIGFREIINQVNPDIVHSHCPRSLIYISCLSKKYKKIYTAHIFPGIQQIALYGFVKGNLAIQVSNFLMRKIDLSIACSESVSKEFLDQYGWKIQAIPNGCSLDIWPVDMNEKVSIRRTLGLDVNTKYFIFIGRFSEEKNPGFLIEAFEELSKRGISLIMLGTGPLFNSFNDKKYKNVRIEGFITDVLPYLKVSDYYISGSKTEGLANTLLESMSVGLPLLLSNIPSHKGVISNSKTEIGMLFDHFNKEDLLRKLHELIAIERHDLFKNVQDEYRGKYTAQMMTENYEIAYKKLL